MMWYYKPKSEYLKDVRAVCKHISDEMSGIVTEKLLQTNKENIMDDMFDIMSSYEKYDLAMTLNINLDSSLILTEEQYKFVRQHEPKMKDWVDILRMVGT